MHNQVHKYSEIRPEIIKAVNIICDPIRGTMGPKGLNVIFERRDGVHSTNDGATIARGISVKNPIHSAIIEIIRSASLQTNSKVGDGTSTTALLSQVLIFEAFKLIDAGYNPTEVKKEYESFAKMLVEKLEKQVIKVKGDDDLLRIATISANNDEEIAKDVVNTVKVAGLDGMVFIEPHPRADAKTEIVEDSGFIVNSGLFSPELRNSKTSMVSTMMKPLVFITDKRLYYPEEAETIMKVALMNGHKNLVVVARDFIGQAPNVFITNHAKGVINLILVKDPNVTENNNETLEDLAIYLGGTVVSDKVGRLVDNIDITNFCVAEKVYSDHQKTILATANPDNPDLAKRIKLIRSELKKADNEELKKRLASLTNGMVTIKVGALSPIELHEKIYRYEDAVNAVRAAVRDGYLVGGGIALKNAFRALQGVPDSMIKNAFKKVCEANIRQIAENCGKHPDTIIEQIEAKGGKNVGYDALRDMVVDLLDAGVIDPYKVTETAIKSSVSVANQIITTNYLIVQNDEEEEGD